ncbi:hypothetical protein WJX74_011054 [Apatococcus lobatus]|uniref:AAA+ ATPase domain-containing protein n=1 Tax=Apatococcus lobatus TaxID=904363 RepID=A0AAW1R1U8_9CHLO
MKDWVLGPSSPQILGRVQHHATRIEVQHRGSLHVHVLLWIHPDDVARIADEIMAPRECDQYVIPFHPTVALVWNASTNIQRITGTAWSFYVLKYAMKSEPIGNLSLGGEVAEALHLQDMSGDQLRLISNMVLAKPVSPAEAAVLMLQHPLVEVSRGDAVMYVCSSLPSGRSMTLRNSRPCTHPIDKYCKRPPTLSEVTFKAYFAEYDVRSKAGGTGELIGRDMANNHVYKLCTPRLVRFSDYNPARSSEGFFFQLLLGAVPFDVEANLVSIGNQTETPYFYECVIRGVFTNMDELQEHLQAYAKLHLYDEQYRMAMYEQLMQSLQGMRTGPLSDMFDFDAAELSGSPVRPATSHMRGIDALSDFDTATLTPEQDGIVAQLLSHPKGLHVISGVPGSGKSFLIKCIARAFTRGHKVVRISATTGAAASRLGTFATTAHSFYALPTKTSYIPSLSRTDVRFEELLGTDVFIIDEMSMLTASNLDIVLYRLYCAAKYIEPSVTQANFLDHKLLILVGDHAQLPAVCHCHVPRGDMCKTCHFSSSTAWPMAKRHRLTRSIRQASDVAYGEFLDAIRVTAPATEVLNNAIADRKVTEQRALTLAEEGIPVLTSHKEDSVRHNREVLDGLFPYTQRKLDLATNADGVLDLVEWLYDSEFLSLPAVAVRSKVMVLQNIRQEDGLVNGALAIVVQLHERDGCIFRIDIRLIDHTERVYVTEDVVYAVFRVAFAFNEKQTYALVNRGILMAELKVLKVYHREEVDSLFQFTQHNADRFKRDNDGQDVASGEQVWFLLKMGENIDRAKLSKKMAWGLIDTFMKEKRHGDIRFFQMMEFYKVFGIGLDQTMSLSKARADAILTQLRANKKRPSVPAANWDVPSAFYIPNSAFAMWIDGTVLGGDRMAVDSDGDGEEPASKVARTGAAPGGGGPSTPAARATTKKTAKK